MTGVGCYLYAIARGLRAEDLAAISGLRGASVTVMEHRGLGAVVSAVDLDEFGEQGLRQHLEDLTWLEEVARTHDAVVQEAAARAPTAPLRLATICLDADGVRARLDEWHDALQRALNRVEGRREWSVKAFADPADSSDATPPGRSEPGAGTAYLVRRKEEMARRRDAAEADAALADELHEALSRHTAASRRLPPQDPRLTGHRGTMTLNGAYLVDDDEADEFQHAVRDLSDRYPASRLDLQGPWPPYSFATLEDS